MSYKTEEVAIREAKKDQMNVLLGAFYIVVYPNGRFDYFPLGMWPTKTAQTTRYFRMMENGKWKQIKLRTPSATK